MVVAPLSISVLVPRIGPKVVIPVGMDLAAVGLVRLAALNLDSTYTANVLPPLLFLGAGIGLVMPPAMSLAISGIGTADAGAGSAAINTMQQVGGAIGTALLNTLAAGAAGAYLADHRPTAANMAQAQLESYSTAYWWSSGLFATGALLAALIFRPGRPDAAPEGSTVIHM